MNYIAEIFGKAGITASEDLIKKFEMYTELLLEYNKKMNLTGITDKNDIAVLHYADSLTLLEYLDINAKIIDIGSGAGFPGVPLKILRPDIGLTLLDSLKKRVNFLETLTEALGLDGVQCVHTRAEDIALNYWEHFDVAVSRAVARLDILSVYALSYVKTGGRAIAMKGPSPQDEIDRAKEYIAQMGGEISQVKGVTLPGGIKHSLVIIDKLSEAPHNLPKKLLKTIKRSRRL